MTDVDWEVVDDALERIIENLNVGASELCELRAFDVCHQINTQVMPTLKDILIRVRTKHREGELPELDTEKLGGALQVLSRDEAREVLETVEFGETFDTNPVVRAAGAVAGDMVLDTETDTYYLIVRGSDLPPRGTGLKTGAAEGGRGGLPRTEAERIRRHREMFGEEFVEEDREFVSEAANEMRLEVLAVAGGVSTEEQRKVTHLMTEIKEYQREGDYPRARRAYEDFIQDCIIRTGDVPEYEEGLSEWFFNQIGEYPPSGHGEELF